MEHYIDTFPGAEITIDQKKYLYFGGTSYLGLQTNETFLNIHRANLNKYGTGYGASRRSNIRLSIYDKVEKYLAAWVGSESCTTMSSGYLAAQMVANSFNKDHYKAFYAPNCHSALFSSLTTARKNKSYITYTSLEIAVRQHLELNPKQTPVVFLDSIDFSGANFPEFQGIRSLPLNKIVLVVDDSHGIGVVGPDGAGVFRSLSMLNAKELIVCASLGKALGIQGGAVFSSKEQYNKLTATDFFGGASPAAPAALASLLEALELIQEKRGRLQGHIVRFSEEIKDLNTIRKIPNYPAFSYSNKALTRFLFDRNIIVTDFAYPTDAAEITSRIVLTAAHEPQHLTELIEQLRRYFQ